MQLLLTNGVNQHNLEVGKIASKTKSLILRNIPEPLCLRLVKLRMLERIDDRITSASSLADPILDFENLDFKIASGVNKILTGNVKKQVTTAKRKAQSEKRSLQANRLLE